MSTHWRALQVRDFSRGLETDVDVVMRVARACMTAFTMCWVEGRYVADALRGNHAVDDQRFQGSLADTGSQTVFAEDDCEGRSVECAILMRNGLKVKTRPPACPVIYTSAHTAPVGMPSPVVGSADPVRGGWAQPSVQSHPLEQALYQFFSCDAVMRLLRDTRRVARIFNGVNDVCLEHVVQSARWVGLLLTYNVLTLHLSVGEATFKDASFESVMASLSDFDIHGSHGGAPAKKRVGPNTQSAPSRAFQAPSCACG